MIMFIPNSQDIQRALVIPLGAHNHPSFPSQKPSNADKARVSEAIHAAGSSGISRHNLVNAPTTDAVCGGRLTTTSEAFMDGRRLTQQIKKDRDKAFPNGVGWEGTFQICEPIDLIAYI